MKNVNGVYETKLMRHFDFGLPQRSVLYVEKFNSACSLIPDEIPDEIFVRGRGWIKTPKKHVLYKPLKKLPESYEELIELKDNYPLEALIILLGLDRANYGDVYPIQDLVLLNIRTLTFYNYIRDLDTALTKWILSYENISIENDNVWANKGTKHSSLYYYHAPFFGRCGYDVIMNGIVYLSEPMLNPMTWEKNYIHMKLWLDGYSAYHDEKSYLEAYNKLNNTSVRDMIIECCGKELADKYTTF